MIAMVSKMMVGLAVVGTLSSCFGDAYQEGKTAIHDKSYLQAVEAFEKACDSGNAQGCFELGSLYEKGEGVVQNKYRASTLYAQACKGGDGHGCSNSTLMYDTP